jgi:cysteine-rich repeat protein
MRMVCHTCWIVLWMVGCGASTTTSPDTTGGDTRIENPDTRGPAAECNRSRADCDGDAANGCEIDLSTSRDHCGICGSICEAANGSADCVDSVCVVQCDEGYTGAACDEDVAECADGSALCDANASCTNALGGYICTCNEHFEGTGSACAPICGDAVLVGDEICDDGNAEAGDGCRADCLGVEACGDGLLDPAVGEECDDGNLALGDGCDDRCENEPVEGPCGDGVVNIDEECDDGNDNDGDGCEGCAAALTDAWTCDPALFKAGDGCECGCGQLDPDCTDATVESCDYCGGQGACNPNDPACQQLTPDNNASCI